MSAVPRRPTPLLPLNRCASLLVVVVFGALLASCGSETAPEVNDPPEVDSEAPPTGVVGSTYDHTLQASGGDGTYVWALADGELPAGLALDDSGLISGTPTRPGISSFTVEVTTGDGQAAVRDFSIEVFDVLASDADTLPSRVVGVPRVDTLRATGGGGGNTWALADGTLPDGLVLEPSGLLAGAPAAAGSYTFALSVTSADGQTAEVGLTLDVHPAVAVTAVTLPEAEVGVPYTQTLTASGGDGTYSWSVTDGALPDGLGLDTLGTISGAAVAPGGTTFSVRVTTGDGQTASVDLRLKAWKPATFVEGYAGSSSVPRGGTIELFTATDGSEHAIRIYRMGWYGGDGRQLVLSIDSVAGVEQAVPSPDPTTGRVEASWSATYTLDADPAWTSGVYLAELEARGAELGRLLFVIRDDAAPADLLVQIPTTTYQAYNPWGGKSLYEYNSTGGRAYEVSFDRPYADAAGPWSGRASSTAGGFFNGDYNLILWLEREGYTATYVASEDVERDASVLSGPGVFVSNFHDEYWSRGMRDNLVGALDAGLHAVFLDSNNIYWQIRWADASDGRPYRVMVGYKDAGLDPMGGSADATVRWRDAPVAEPENGLLGVMYAGDYAYGSSFPWVVENAAHWVYEGTGLADGDEIEGLVGYEYDRVWSNGATPAGLTVLASSPVVDRSGAADVHNATIHTRSSGAIVFAAGTNYWSWFLDATYKPNGEDARVQRMTRNLLDRMLGG